MKDKTYFEAFLENLKQEYWKVESDLRFNGGGSAKIADGFITVKLNVDDKRGVSISIDCKKDLLTKELFQYENKAR